MIALILGGAPSWRDDLAAAEAILAGLPRLVVAANLAIVHYEGRIDAGVSYHSEMIAAWAAERAAGGGNTDFRAFTPSPAGMPTEIVDEAWDGSSGLYAVRVALLHLGASGAICCGVPLERDAGHFIFPGQWAPVTTYRQEWQAVAPLIGERTRSMAGWTAQTFGTPSPQWIAAHA